MCDTTRELDDQDFIDMGDKSPSFKRTEEREEIDSDHDTMQVDSEDETEIEVHEMPKRIEENVILLPSKEEKPMKKKWNKSLIICTSAMMILGLGVIGNIVYTNHQQVSWQNFPGKSWPPPDPRAGEGGHHVRFYI